MLQKGIEKVSGNSYLRSALPEAVQSKVVAMKKEELYRSASQLPLPGEDCAKAFKTRRGELVEELYTRMASRRNLMELVGERNVNRIKENQEHYIRSMEALMFSFYPDTLVDTVLWVFRAYRLQGFKDEYWRTQLADCIEILNSKLPVEQRKNVLPLYQWMLENSDSIASLSNSLINYNGAAGRASGSPQPA